MIGHMPLWMVLAIWWVQRRNQPRISLLNYSRMIGLLNDVYYSLPIPNSKIETRVVTEVVKWIDREKAALTELVGLGAIALGTIKK